MTPPRVRPVFTVWIHLCAVAWLAAHAVLGLLLLPWSRRCDPDRRAIARLASLMVRGGVRLVRSWRGASAGFARVRLDRPTIVVMNHRSSADIVLAVGMPGAPKIVSNGWAARLPLLGLNMRLCRHVVHESGRDRPRDLLAHLAGLLRRGNSVLIFPEGTRRTEPGLGRFRDGAFRLAVDTGADVLPVVVHGTGEALPRGSWVWREADVDLEVLPAIPAGSDRRALSAAVHAAMAAAVAARTAAAAEPVPEGLSALRGA